MASAQGIFDKINEAAFQVLNGSNCLKDILNYLNQGCPNYGARANCGLPSIFDWPISKPKNIMECIAVLS